MPLHRTPPSAARRGTVAGRLALHTAVLAALLAALTACQRPVFPETGTAASPSLGLQQVDPERVDVGPTPAELVLAQVDLNDKVRDLALTAEINAELSHEPQLRGLLIEVDSVGGHVALRGEAPDASTRDLATERALRVPGVRSIDNQLQVGGPRG